MLFGALWIFDSFAELMCSVGSIGVMSKLLGVYVLGALYVICFTSLGQLWV